MQPGKDRSMLRRRQLGLFFVVRDCERHVWFDTLLCHRPSHGHTVWQLQHRCQRKWEQQRICKKITNWASHGKTRSPWPRHGSSLAGPPMQSVWIRFSDHRPLESPHCANRRSSATASSAILEVLIGEPQDRHLTPESVPEHPMDLKLHLPS